MTNFSDECNLGFYRRVASGGSATMSYDAEPPEWFIELWLAASDGEASNAELDRLSNLIAKDATARSQLFELAQLHAWLEWLRPPEE